MEKNAFPSPKTRKSSVSGAQPSAQARVRRRSALLCRHRERAICSLIHHACHCDMLYSEDLFPSKGSSSKPGRDVAPPCPSAFTRPSYRSKRLKLERVGLGF